MALQTTSVIVEEALIKQVASMAILRATPHQIADKLQITVYLAKKLLASPKCREILKEIGEESVTIAKQQIRHQTSEMAKDIVRVLRVQLDKDNLEAVKVALKVIGFDQEEKVEKSASLTVIMPGASQPKNVNSEVITIDQIQDTGGAGRVPGLADEE